MLVLFCFGVTVAVAASASLSCATVRACALRSHILPTPSFFTPERRRSSGLSRNKKQNRQMKKKKSLLQKTRCLQPPLTFPCTSCNVWKATKGERWLRRRWRRSNQRNDVSTHVCDEREKHTETEDGLFSILTSGQTLHCQKTSVRHEIRWGRSSSRSSSCDSRSNCSSNARPPLVVSHGKFFYLAARTAGLLCNTALVTETYITHASTHTRTQQQQQRTEKVLKHPRMHLHIF